MMLVEGEPYSPALSCAGLHRLPAKSEGKSTRNKRRFRDDQIKSLESIFENESKLEPRKKLQLAKELGLQPRQVAIWFQNKRARSKSKQLERDYNLLMDNYNGLANRFESLKEERQSLLLQLQKLNDLVDKAQAENQFEGDGCKIIGTEILVKNQDLESNCDDINAKNRESEHKEGFPLDQSANCFEMEEESRVLLAMAEPACSSLTSDEDWQSLHSDGLFGQCMSSSEWLDFWASEEPSKW